MPLDEKSDDVRLKSSTEGSDSDGAESPAGFSSLNLAPDLLQAIHDLGFTEPTPIQADAIPPALEGRDVLGAAMTGSGKTAAFLLPILHQLQAKQRGVTRGLVLTPTRELAAQVEQHLQALAKYTDLKAAVIHGGVAFEPQEHAIRRGFDVIIATPGRLLDHLRRPYGHLDKVEFLVLDEADRMLDMGFIPDVRRILAKMPARRQTMLFSATMPGPIASLSRELLREPATINIERKAAPATGITQAAYFVRHAYKPALLLHLLRHGGIENALAFTRTKDRADRLSSYLNNHGVRVTAIHGDRSQVQRTRALEAFKSGKFRVLVATDVAARGIDVEGLSHVINVDVPAQPEDYIHRIGRTGRQKATGDAMTFVAARELADLHAIERAIRSKLPRIRVEGFDYDRGRSELDDPASAEKPKAEAKTPAPKGPATARGDDRKKPGAPQPATPQPTAPQPATPKPAAPQPAAPQPAAAKPAAPQPAAAKPAAPPAVPAATAPSAGTTSPSAARPAAPVQKAVEAPEASAAEFENEIPLEARESEIAPVEPSTNDRSEVLYRFICRSAWRRGEKAPAKVSPPAEQPKASKPPQRVAASPAKPAPAPRPAESLPAIPEPVVSAAAKPQSATPRPAVPPAATPQPATPQPATPQPAAPQPAVSKEVAPPAVAPQPVAARPVASEPAAPSAAAAPPAAARPGKPGPDRAEVLKRFRSMRRRQRG